MYTVCWNVLRVSLERSDGLPSPIRDSAHHPIYCQFFKDCHHSLFVSLYICFSTCDLRKLFCQLNLSSLFKFFASLSPLIEQERRNRRRGGEIEWRWIETMQIKITLAFLFPPVLYLVLRQTATKSDPLKVGKTNSYTPSYIYSQLLFNTFHLGGEKERKCNWKIPFIVCR